MQEIELESVHKSFGNQPVLRDVSLRLVQGQQVCLVGSSGAGKTVLSKLFLGLETPDVGRVVIGGKNTADFRRSQWAEWLDQCGVVFQGAALFDSLTICENVGIKLRERDRLPEKEIRDRVAEALQQVNLSPSLLDQYPESLSGGMRKRVGIARAIVHHPAWLFVDEPTAGLDPANSAAIDQLLSELAKSGGRTCFIVTHHLRTLHAVADRVLLLAEGQLAYDGAVQSFLNSESEAVIAWRGE